MVCPIAELGLALAERRLTWTPEQLTLARTAIRDGCLPNPHASPADRARFDAILLAHAGRAPPAEPLPRLSAADRREAIVEALRADPQASDRAIARKVGCSDKTVASVRVELGLRNPHVKASANDGGNIG